MKASGSEFLMVLNQELEDVDREIALLRKRREGILHVLSMLREATGVSQRIKAPATLFIDDPATRAYPGGWVLIQGGESMRTSQAVSSSSPKK